jgi:hypothetical protein
MQNNNTVAKLDTKALGGFTMLCVSQFSKRPKGEGVDRSDGCSATREFSPLLQISNGQISLATFLSEKWLKQQEEGKAIFVGAKIPHLQRLAIPTAGAVVTDCSAKSRPVEKKNFVIRAGHRTVDSIGVSVSSSTHAYAALAIEVPSEVFRTRQCIHAFSVPHAHALGPNHSTTGETSKRQSAIAESLFLCQLKQAVSEAQIR